MYRNLFDNKAYLALEIWNIWGYPPPYILHHPPEIPTYDSPGWKVKTRRSHAKRCTNNYHRLRGDLGGIERNTKLGRGCRPTRCMERKRDNHVLSWQGGAELGGNS